MFANLAVVVLAALILSFLFEKIKLPGLLGMILTGIIFGPYVLDFISPEVLQESAELRSIALIVILIRAGLGISRKTLHKVGKSAVKMSFIPCIIEGAIVTVASHFILGLPLAEAGILGFIIAAVSPAVVVPQMLHLKEMGLGENKDVPTLVLAGASVDDVFAITIFGAFMALALGEHTNPLLLIGKIPLSIVLGIGAGAILGFALVWFFKRVSMRDTLRVLIFMIIAVLFHELENFLPIATLIGIMTIGFVILEKYNTLAKRFAGKFNKIWVFAEILLFVLIGAEVNIGVAADSGLLGLAIIGIAILARASGVLIALIRSHLDLKEKLFCVIAYTPKATVQAAIGAIPLAAGIASGEVILAIAVLSIIVTAPLGALGIRLSAHRLLYHEKPAG